MTLPVLAVTFHHHTLWAALEANLGRDESHPYEHLSLARTETSILHLHPHSRQCHCCLAPLISCRSSLPQLLHYRLRQDASVGHPGWRVQLSGSCSHPC